jgi:hypothetical protein
MTEESYMYPFKKTIILINQKITKIIILYIDVNKYAKLIVFTG